MKESIKYNPDHLFWRLLAVFSGLCCGFLIMNIIIGIINGRWLPLYMFVIPIVGIILALGIVAKYYPPKED